MCPDVYLVLARSAHGRRYWLLSSDPEASVPAAERVQVVGPARIGADGYDTEEAAAEALADEVADEVVIAGRGKWRPVGNDNEK